MKKITLLLTILTISIMASGDVLAQRHGGGPRGGGPRGGGRPGGARLSGEGPRIDRAGPARTMQVPSSIQRRNTIERNFPDYSATNRLNAIERPTPGFTNQRQRSNLNQLRTQQHNSMQQWTKRSGSIDRPDFAPGGRYAHRKPHHHPHHHHHPYYPGWRPRWWAVPVAWGAGAAWWNWNTSTYPYYNPYVVYLNDPNYNYSEPVYDYTDENPNTLSATESGMVTETPTAQAAMEYFQQARESFKSNNYDGALREIDRAIEKMPRDAVFHEFRALIFFAQGKYNQAAAVVNSVLASGPGWNWDTMINLYQNPEQYTDQLRNLEAFTRRHKQDAAAKFLLAYHYLVMGFTDNAAAQLQQVVELQPKDVLAKRLLGMIEDAQKASADSTPERPAPQE